MKKISSRIHHELAQLKKSNTKTRSDKLFRFKNLLAPGLGDVIKERLDTADFLNEVLVVVGTGVSVFLDNSISLQQCEINTKHLNDGLERTFSLINTELKISRKIPHILNEIQPLKTLLDEYDETTSSKRRREKK
ncbi:hypothetical protein FRC03_002701 [Tulasnella sp. 419]|nr:hypothetical protein FRC03_002701 [Tulasnella sp. 419]